MVNPRTDDNEEKEGVIVCVLFLLLGITPGALPYWYCDITVL